MKTKILFLLFSIFSSFVHNVKAQMGPVNNSLDAYENLLYLHGHKLSPRVLGILLGYCAEEIWVYKDTILTSNPVSAITFVDANRIAVGESDGSLSIWDLSKECVSEPIRTSPHIKCGAIKTLAMAQDKIYFSDNSKKIIKWNPGDGKCKAVEDSCKSEWIAYSYAAQRLLAGSTHGKLLLLRNAGDLVIFNPLSPLGFKVSPSGKFVAFNNGNTVQLYSIAYQFIFGTIKAVDSKIASFDWLTETKLISAENNHIVIWDAVNIQNPHVIDRYHAEPMTRIYGLNAGAQYVAINKKNIWLGDTTEQRYQIIDYPEGAAFAQSRDRSYFAVSRDREIALWENITPLFERYIKSSQPIDPQLVKNAIKALQVYIPK